MRKREKLWGVLQADVLPKYTKRTSEPHHINPPVIMKEWMEPIDSELPLAKAFNRIITDLELLRIMTNPRIFSDSTDKEGHLRMHNYYLTVLWERWLHGVFNRLVEWANTISSYFDEYNGSWEYYAVPPFLRNKRAAISKICISEVTALWQTILLDVRGLIPLQLYLIPLLRIIDP